MAETLTPQRPELTKTGTPPTKTTADKKRPNGPGGATCYTYCERRPWNFLGMGTERSGTGLTASLSGFLRPVPSPDTDEPPPSFFLMTMVASSSAAAHKTINKSQLGHGRKNWREQIGKQS